MSFIYRVATTFAAILFAEPGIALVIGYPHFVSDMTLLGYILFPAAARSLEAHCRRRHLGARPSPAQGMGVRGHDGRRPSGDRVALYRRGCRDLAGHTGRGRSGDTRVLGNSPRWPPVGYAMDRRSAHVTRGVGRG